MTEKEKNSKKPLEIKSVPWILVTGDQGSGKSRLAATIPDAYCIDNEDGAASCYPETHRKVFPYDHKMYENVTNHVASLLKNTTKEGRFRVGEKLKISALVIDTFDTLQKVLITRYLESKKKPHWIKPDQIWAPTMEQRDWGIILNYQSKLIADLQVLGIPVIWVCHSKVVEPIYQGYGDNMTLRKQGALDLDVSGSIQKWIVNLSSYILHIVVTENGARQVYTQPTVVQDQKILAKDRHNLFKNEEKDWTLFNLPADENGFPKSKVMTFILENHVY